MAMREYARGKVGRGKLKAPVENGTMDNIQDSLL